MNWFEWIKGESRVENLTDKPMADYVEREILTTDQALNLARRKEYELKRKEFLRVRNISV